MNEGIWMPQMNMRATTCRGCQKRIPAGVRYHRLVFEPDGVDALGKDFCARCFGAAMTEKQEVEA